jgi:hypothetical protein
MAMAICCIKSSSDSESSIRVLALTTVLGLNRNGFIKMSWSETLRELSCSHKTLSLRDST